MARYVQMQPPVAEARIVFYLHIGDAFVSQQLQQRLPAVKKSGIGHGSQVYAAGIHHKFVTLRTQSGQRPVCRIAHAVAVRIEYHGAVGFQEFALHLHFRRSGNKAGRRSIAGLCRTGIQQKQTCRPCSITKRFEKIGFSHNANSLLFITSHKGNLKKSDRMNDKTYFSAVNLS